MRLIQTLALIVVALGGLSTVSCAPGSMASSGAGSGAKQGALGGAVAGAVGSLFWGGNPMKNIAASAAIGATSGAAMGAASGASADQKIAARREMSEQDAAIAQRLGQANYDAAVALADCKHKRAIGLARTAYGTAGDDEHRRYALMIEAIAAEESGDTETGAKVYPLLVRVDPALETVDGARADALAGILEIQKLRQDFGRPPICR
ncbi:MAG: hypothetical protein OEW88_12870 [Gammaproteobacteria bacterium]|jgi:hypothetical protein|nr:hypothetical protein [Gammaproteobacteria bacterium]MDH5277308.1 hypothetical protein [Gammaproteobacteria bacterium]